MTRNRSRNGLDFLKSAPPLLRSMPRDYFDSEADGGTGGQEIAHTFRARGRMRNVVAKLPLPQGALVAVRAFGEAAFELELGTGIFLCRFGIRGRTRYEADGRSFELGANLLCSPGSHARARSMDPAILLLALRRECVERALCGEAPPRVGMRALGGNSGEDLRRSAFDAADEAERLPESLRKKFLRNFQNAAAFSLAEALRGFLPDTRRPEPMIGRRRVADLREWAALDHGEPPTVGDLAARCGLGLRALQKNFLRHFDTTPLLYMRELRLLKAHRLLSDAGAAWSVTEAALESGFAHLGRFPAAYRERFGELPSATRERTHRGGGA